MIRRIQFSLFAIFFSSCSVAQVPPAQDQIGGAVLAAPAEAQEGAAVMGYDKPGSVVQLREGTNEFVCLADNPAEDGFSVACYHKDLEPYMARGRELRAGGVGENENLETRAAEVEDGTLAWPTAPSSLYIRSGEEGAYDAASGVASGTSLRYVVYMAYATPESTGLSARPGAPGAPWIMAGGTFRAHLMIIPPAPPTDEDSDDIDSDDDDSDYDSDDE